MKVFEQLEVNIWFVAKCFLPRQLERVKEMAENLYHLIQLVDINSKQLGSLDVVGLYYKALHLSSPSLRYMAHFLFIHLQILCRLSTLIFSRSFR